VAKTAEGYGRQFLQAARARRVFGDMYIFGTTVMKFTVADVAAKISAPTLVTAYQDDTLVIPPSQQGPVVYKLLRSKKQWHYFTATAPKIPLIPRRRSARHAGPDLVGNGTDYSAQVSGLISQATGTFQDVSSGITAQGTG
jgi:hypothetical protein